jgi:hypothetical protein
MGSCSGCHDVAIGDNDMDGRVGSGDGTVGQFVSHLVKMCALKFMNGGWTLSYNKSQK